MRPNENAFFVSSTAMFSLPGDKSQTIVPPIMDPVAVKQGKTIVVSVVMDYFYVHVLQ